MELENIVPCFCQAWKRNVGHTNLVFKMSWNFNGAFQISKEAGGSMFFTSSETQSYVFSSFSSCTKLLVQVDVGEKEVHFSQRKL